MVDKKIRDAIRDSLIVVLLGLVTIFLQAGILTQINSTSGAMPDFIKDNARNWGDIGILISLVSLIVLVIVTRKKNVLVLVRATKFFVGAAIIIISGASMVQSGFRIPEMVVDTLFMVFGAYILFRGLGKKFLGV